VSDHSVLGDAEQRVVKQGHSGEQAKLLGHRPRKAITLTGRWNHSPYLFG
jgi:hypothetical protein